MKFNRCLAPNSVETAASGGSSGSTLDSEIVMGELGGFFCKVEGGPKIAAKEHDLAIQVLFEKRLSILVGELAMNINGCLA